MSLDHYPVKSTTSKSVILLYLESKLKITMKIDGPKYFNVYKIVDLSVPIENLIDEISKMDPELITENLVEFLIEANLLLSKPDLCYFFPEDNLNRDVFWILTEFFRIMNKYCNQEIINSMSKVIIIIENGIFRNNLLKEIGFFQIKKMILDSVCQFPKENSSLILMKELFDKICRFCNFIESQIQPPASV